MAYNTQNITRWIEQSKIDYIGYFIKAWIPFNAWYTHSYTELKTDRNIINAILHEPNSKVRNAVNSYIKQDTPDGNRFRELIGELYTLLDDFPIYTDNDKKGISFKNEFLKRNMEKEININNESKSENVDKYSLKRVDGKQYGKVIKIEISITRGNNTVFKYEHDSYDINHLQSYQGFSSLTDNRKNKLKSFFDAINPQVAFLLTETVDKNDKSTYHECGKHLLRTDKNDQNFPTRYICIALIEVLYELRCVCFHGELVPDENAQRIFRPAYHILMMILENLK